MILPSEKSIRLRAAFVYLGFATFLCVVAARLVQLQVYPQAELKNLGARQLHRTGKNAPYRLPILDRNGEELAISVPASSIFARPKLIRNPKRTARVLSGMLGGGPQKWLKKLRSSRPFVWLDRQVSAETARKIAERSLPGIFIESENKRIYPNGKLAAHVLGFTDIDGNGLAGIELKFNEELLKPENSGVMVRDGRGKTSYVGRDALNEVSKKGVYLTIDRRLQSLLEEELEESLQSSHSQAALGIILDPATGEVLAMAQRPAFDPGFANRFPQELLTNRLVGHLLEPGSTLKVLFAAEAIELGLLKKDSLIPCEKGRLRIGDKVFSEAHSHSYAQLPLENVIRYSSNIGAIKVAQLLGPRRLAAALDKFGLTSRTGIELPGETTSSPRSDAFWTPIHLATVGFGQGLSTSPLQLVASFMPFANGGYWIRPHVTPQAYPGEGTTAGMKRVLSPKAAAMVRDILIGVTEEKGGTGSKARMVLARVAGKTGTAQKYEKEGGYQSGKYYASFVGFLPAERPELLIGVMLDEPGNEYYSSQVAAPLFKRVAERALPLVHGVPARPTTAFGSFATKSPRVPANLETAGPGLWKMPDLKGASVREALRLIGTRLDRVHVSGSGYLAEQDPDPGEVVGPKTTVQLRFQPRG